MVGGGGGREPREERARPLAPDSLPRVERSRRSFTYRLSGCGLFFRELFFEALAGAVEADRCGVLRAVEGDGELGSGQSLPRGEAEDLLVVPAELLQRGDDLRKVGALVA